MIPVWTILSSLELEKGALVWTYRSISSEFCVVLLTLTGPGGGGSLSCVSVAILQFVAESP